MVIGGTKRDIGVLKLVHLGGNVEIHTEPVTAAQVMSKNPRHCITRPDFFKYPSIVVRPESVLQLGRVFYIVPNCTIHHQLHRVSSHRQSPSLQKRHASKHPHRHQHFKKQFQVDSSTELSSKYQHHDLWKQQFPCEHLFKTSKDLVSDGHVKQQSKIEPRVKTTSNVHDHARRHKRGITVKSYSKASPRNLDYINRRFQSLAKVIPLLHGIAAPNSIEKTPKHDIIGQHGYRLNRQSLLKYSNETTTGDLYHGQLKQQSTTYSWHEVTKKEDHSTTSNVHDHDRCHKRGITVKSYSKATPRNQDYINRQFQSLTKVIPLLQGSAEPNPSIEKTPKHAIVGKHGYHLNQKSLIKYSNETTTGDLFYGQLEQQSATHSCHEVTKKEDHSTTFKEHSVVSNETTAREKYQGRLEQQSSAYSPDEVTKKEDPSKTFKEHSVVTNKATTGDKYLGRLEQHSATYSRHEVKEEHKKRFKENSAVSNETTIGDNYHGRIAQHAATYSWHEMTKKEYHRKVLKEYLAVSDDITTGDEYQGQLEQQSATYSENEVTKKEHSKPFKEHSVISNETATRDKYHGQLEQHSATYSCHDMTKKEEHSKGFKEHVAVSNETTTGDHYHGRIEQNSATYSCHEVTKKEEHGKRLKGHSAVDQERPSHAKGHDIDDRSAGGGDGLESPTKQDKRLLNQLKSCLQKNDSDGRSRGLRVTFSFPKEGDEKPECSRSRFCC